MEKEARRIRRTEKKPSGLTSWLRREGRRCCAVALCVSMIVGNAANLAFAAEESISGSFLFRLDRASLYDALQEAVLEGDIVDKEFEFQGEAAEEYGLLLNETEGHDGELYELRPEIAHNEGNLGLRIFARLDGEIPLGDEEETIEYEITGSEEFIFLLTNRSHKEYQAVIQVDDKRSEVITVVPGSSLQAGLEDSPYTSAADFGPGETEGAEGAVDAGITTAPGGGSGGGGGGGSSHKGSTPQEGAEDTANREDTEDGTQGGSQESSGTADKNNDKIQNPDQEGAGGNDHNSGSAQEGNASDSADNSSDSQNGADLSGSDHNQSGNNDSDSSHSGNNSDKSDSDKNDSADSGHDSGSAGGSASQGGSSENSGSADSGSGSSDSDHSSDSGSSGGGAGSSSGSEGGSSSSGGSEGGSSGSEGSSSGGGSSSGSSSDSGSSSSGSGSSDSGSGSSGGGSSDSGSSSSGSGSSDSGSGSSGGGSSDSGSSSSGGGGGEQSASISRHGVSLVTMSLDEIVADEAVASPSDAEAAEKADEIETGETSQTEGTGEAAADQKAEEATPSDADEDVLDGQIYEAVLLGEDAAVAFVTTASEMLLDEEDYRTASPSNAYPAKIREFNADGVVVVVEAEDGVLPEDAELTVTELVKEEADTAEQYERAEKALEEAGAEYAGMMAFDISFWLDGEEIEPDGPVQVSMRVDSEKLPKEADPESLEIHHLVGTDEVEAVEIVADTGDKAEGIVEVDEAEALAAEFEVESFSTFTITWGVMSSYEYGNVKIKLNATCYNKDGSELDEQIEDIEVPYLYSDKVDYIELDLQKDSQTAQIGWYRFVKASAEIPETIDSPTREKKEFTKLRIVASGWQQVGEKEYRLNEIYVYYWNNVLMEDLGFEWYEDVSVGAERISLSPESDTVNLNVSITYEKDNRQIRIVDNIKTDGCLKAELSPTFSEGDKTGVSYKWTKSSNGSNWTSVEERNISENRKSVNVANDEGARNYYRVELCDKDKKTIGTDEFFVEYYDHLENGSFEKPIVSGSSEGGYNNYYQYPEGYDELIWKTTESTKTIEIVKKKNNNHNLQRGETELPQGFQCAELNSRAEGALYQDVLTVPGSTLNWRLYHRPRGPQAEKPELEDTMYLVIMPTVLAEDYSRNHEALKKAVEGYLNGGNVYDDQEKGIYVEKMTSSGYKWTEYTGTYETGNRENSCLTRFFFIASDQVSSGDIREGNLLDDVWFDTELPPPKPKTGNLSIKKIVSGFADLSKEDRENYKLNLEISKDGKKIETITLSNFREGANGTWYDYINCTDWEPGDYTVKETASSVDNYDLKSSVREVNRAGGDDFRDGSSITVNVAEDQTTYVEFKNDYTPQTTETKTLTVTKEVEGNLGDKSKDFTFEFKIVDDEGQDLSDYNDIKVGGEEVTVDKKFQLHHGQSINIENIPSGYKVIIKEIDADGYEVSAEATGENNKELLLKNLLNENNAIVKGAYELTMSEDTEVIFTNKRSVSTPTGLHGSMLPNLLLLAMAALGMAGMAATGTAAKARKKEEE